jgi:hypothetical protein
MSTIAAALTLSSRRQRRRELATLIRNRRAALNHLFEEAYKNSESGCTLKRAEINKCVWYSFRDRWIPKHERHLRDEALADLKFSRQPLPGIDGSGSYDTDYYSYCGLADAHCDQLHQAWEDAKLSAAMYKLSKQG